MTCAHCGSSNNDPSLICVQCGASLLPLPPAQIPAATPPPAGPLPYIPNYLVWAILSTICCCLPFGIVAIVYAAKVNGLLQGGNYPAAMDASRKAKMWCWIALGAGIAISLIWFSLSVASSFLHRWMELKHMR